MSRVGHLIQLRPRPETIFVSSDRPVLATERDGFLDNAPEQGLFVDQTRVLSRYCHLLIGVRPKAVTVSNVEQHSWMGYYITSAPDLGDGRATLIAPEEAAQESIELRLSRYVSGGMHGRSSRIATTPPIECKTKPPAQ